MRGNRIILLILFAGLFGCKSKDVTVDKSDRNRDSVATVYRVDTVIETIRERDTVFIKVKDPQSSNVVIDDPCDSITGLLRKFEIRAGNTTITSDGSGLSVQTACDSIIQINKQKTMTESRLLSKIRELESKLKNKETSVKVSEKTGIAGTWQLFKAHILSFIAGVVAATIFWFIMRLMGKV